MVGLEEPSTKLWSFHRCRSPSIAAEQRLSVQKYLTGPMASVQINQHASAISRHDKPADCPLDHTFEIADNANHIHSLGEVKRGKTIGHVVLDIFDRWRRKSQVHEQEPLLRTRPQRSTASASLAEKYGKCREVLHYGNNATIQLYERRPSMNASMRELHAVKVFHRRPGKFKRCRNSEYSFSSSLHHQNIVQTLDLLLDHRGHLCQAMEYCAGGDLHTLISTSGKLAKLEADCFFKQLMRGIQYLHANGVAHRDLKPEHILLTIHGTVKIVDFGNAECFHAAWDEQSGPPERLSGTIPYIAPEVYLSRNFDPTAVDVWAAGLIYMAMRTGRLLWRSARENEDGRYREYVRGRKEKDGYAPIEALGWTCRRNVIYAMLDPESSRRISSSDVLRSEWVHEITVCHAGEQGL
ncbi:hypothetical protein VTN02DRAFT_6512 [Thermoascus thermophilus]